MTYDYDDIKAIEKQKLQAAEAELDQALLKAKEIDFVEVEKVHPQQGETAVFNLDTTQLLLGLALITIGVLALTTQFEIWRFWWLIFLFKPLFFGWGKKHGRSC